MLQSDGNNIHELKTSTPNFLNFQVLSRGCMLLLGPDFADQGPARTSHSSPEIGHQHPSFQDAAMQCAHASHIDDTRIPVERLSYCNQAPDRIQPVWIYFSGYDQVWIRLSSKPLPNHSFPSQGLWCWYQRFSQHRLRAFASDLTGQHQGFLATWHGLRYFYMPMSAILSRWVWCPEGRGFSHWKLWMIGDMGISKNSGTPKWMVKIMENPIKKDNFGVPLFLETPTLMLFSGEKMAKGCFLWYLWWWMIDRWIFWIQSWSSELKLHICNFQVPTSWGGPDLGKTGIATTGHLGREKVQLSSFASLQMGVIKRYIADSRLWSTFVVVTKHSMHIRDVSFKVVVNPEAYSALEWLALALLQGAQYISWKGIACVSVCQEEAHTYEQKRHLLFSKLRLVCWEMP